MMINHNIYILPQSNSPITPLAIPKPNKIRKRNLNQTITKLNAFRAVLNHIN